MNLANGARRLLINIGKLMPFILCFILNITYLECGYALIFRHFIYYHDYITLDTPISFVVGNVLEYDLLVVLVTLIISVAIEACKWNLWADCYLFLHLCCKFYFNFELEIWQIYFIIIINLIISLFFVCKGVKILTKT